MKSCILAFAMYSKIPMPRVEWNEENQKYIMCFFPVVGLVIGAIMFGIAYFFSSWFDGGIAMPVLMTIVPMLLTGGIHMDGYLDTIDALKSFKGADKKRQILKDPHMGAFAFLYGCMYFLISIAAWSLYEGKGLLVIVITYILSRACSAFSVVTLKVANNSILVKSFAKSASEQKKKTQIVCLSIIALCLIFITWIHVWFGIGVAICIILVSLYHYHNCKVTFEGMNGDLAGFYLQINELLMLITIIVIGRFV